MDIIARYFELGNNYWWVNHCNSSVKKMNKAQAQAAIKRILKDPGIADQYTEEEIEKIEELAARK